MYPVRAIQPGYFRRDTMAWSKTITKTPQVAEVGNVRREHNGTRRYSFDEMHFWKTGIEALRSAPAILVKTGEHTDYGYPVPVFSVRANPHYLSGYTVPEVSPATLEGR